MRTFTRVLSLAVLLGLWGPACSNSTAGNSGATGGSRGASASSSGGGSRIDTSSAGGSQSGSRDTGGRTGQGDSTADKTSSSALAGTGGNGGKSSSTGGAGGTGGTGGSASVGGTTSGGTHAGGTAGQSGVGGSGGTGASAGATAGASGPADAGVPDATVEAGVTDYLPCPTDGTPCKILPYGDSITQGFPFAAQGGYRAPLFHLALADKKNLTFIGSLQDGPDKVDGVAFPKNHEGHFAMTIEWLTSTSNVPDKAIQPAHIILLHAGTNNRSGQPADAAKKLEALIDRILKVAPNAMLYVATIILCNDLGPEDDFVRAYDPLIAPIVEKRAKEGKHIKLVDQYSSFDPKTMFSPPEKYHPNLVGYAHMADVWYAAIKSVLP